MYLGIERALKAQFLGADLGRYNGGSAEDQILFQITELMPVNGPEKDLQRIRDVWAFCEDVWATQG